MLAALLRAPNAGAPRSPAGPARWPRARRRRPPATPSTLRSTGRSRPRGGAAPALARAPHAAPQRLPPRARGARRRRERRSTTLDAAFQRVAAECCAARSRRSATATCATPRRSSPTTRAARSSPGSAASRPSARAPHVDGVRARRQAGSTLKPFLYAPALDERLVTPATLLDDTPLDVAGAGGLYRPENYDREFRGLVPVREALASSLNVPAVRALQLVGAERARSRSGGSASTGSRETPTSTGRRSRSARRT